MIIVDTSVWVDHFRSNNAIMDGMLERNEVLIHPVVIGELALGRLPDPDRVLAALLKLPAAAVASDDEVLELIRRNAMAGTGIGYADAHLLASTRLTGAAFLWTRDRRLQAVARRLGLDAEIEPYSGLQED